MHRVYLGRQLTAFEIRDPLIGACKEIASEKGFFAVFNQGQQAAFDGHYRMRRSQRKRIGNGKHKWWKVNYQEEPPQTDPKKCHNIGTLVIKSHFSPDQK